MTQAIPSVTDINAATANFGQQGPGLGPLNSVLQGLAANAGASGGALGPYTSVALLQVAFPAATNTGKHATVNNQDYVSDGVNWVIAGIGASLSAYTTTIPLDGNKYMADVALSAAATFTAGTSAVGGACEVGLVADGVGGHVPTLSAFNLDPGSDAYNNTANRLNYLYFYNVAGRNWVTIRDTGLTVTPAATAVTLSGPSTAPVGAPSSNFSVGANGGITGSVIVTPAAVGGGTFSPTSVTLTSGSPTGTFTYTAASAGSKTISVTNNGGLSNPSSIALTASTGLTIVRMNNSSLGQIESGDATNGWNYDTTGYYNNYGDNTHSSCSNLKLPSGVDGYFQYTLANNDPLKSTLLIALRTTQSTSGAGFAGTLFGIYGDQSSPYKGTLAASGGIALSPSTTPANGDIVRIGRAGTTGYCDVSQDGGTTFARLQSTAGVTTADLWMQMMFGGCTANNVRGNAVA